jgi:hypothetical protein
MGDGTMNRFTKNSLVVALIACVFLGSANLASAKGGHGGGHHSSHSSHKSGSHTHKVSHKTTAKKTTKKTSKKTTQKTTKKNGNKQAKHNHRHHRHHSGYGSYDYLPVDGAADLDGDDDASDEVAMAPAYEISE